MTTSSQPPIHLRALSLIDPDSVRRVVLRNGLTVLLHRYDSAPVVAIVTYVKAGYFDETDDVTGIAHVLEHMYFKGTEVRGVGEIAKQTKASGGYLNAHTIYDHTNYVTVLPSSGFAHGLEVQADAFANSVIDADELAKELEVIIQEAKRKADNPSAVAAETLFELLHDRHRMRRWRIGREPGLRALTRDKVLDFYRNFYRPGNVILSLAGDLDMDDALERVERLYGPIADAVVEREPGPAETAGDGFRYREWEGDIAQTQLVAGWRTPGTLDPDTPLLDLAALVLGSGRASRLYRAVRERKLAASVSAYNYTPAETGVFVVHAETPPDRTLAAARGIWEQVRSLRERGMGEQELERARRVVEARWIRRLETAEGRATHLAEWEALGDWELGDRYLERLSAASAEDAGDAVRHHLVPERAAMAVYRPERSETIAGTAGAMRDLLDFARPAPLPPTPPRVISPVRAGPSPAALERMEAGVRVYRTEGGVPILIRQRGTQVDGPAGGGAGSGAGGAGASMAHFAVFARGGSSHESAANAGVTSLLARTALKGTERRTANQIAEDSEMLGGSIGVSVGGESFGWTLSVPARHAAEALDLLSDVSQHPVIGEDALETERALAISAVRLARDDMFRYPIRLALGAAFPAHPYGLPVSGTEESLGAISAGQVREWHRTRVLAAPAVVAVVGDLDPDALARLVARDFSELRMSEPLPVAQPEWPETFAVATEFREKAQTALALAFPSPSRRDTDRHAARLLAGIASGLGGRFFEELRDRQSLAYTVQAFVSERVHSGLFLSYIATSPDQEDTARRGLLAEFARLRDELVGDEELTRAKTYAIGSHAIRQQSGGAVLAELLDAWLVGGGLAELEDHDERIRAVTGEAMRELARRFFVEDRRVEGVVRGVGGI
ncbi:MAG: M16 family metallopeptidase [Gemmatimonadaceae bacterium]